VVSLLSRDDWGVRGQHKVDTRIWHQVGLELRDIDVQSTIETKGGSEGRDDLSDQTVQVGVSGSLNVQVASANVVQGLVIQAESAVSVLQKGVGRKDVIVWLDDGSGDLRSGGDSEGKLGLSAIVNRETLQKEGSETRSSSSTGRVEDQKALKTSAVISELSEAVKDKVNNLLANGVVTTGVVVGSILLAGDELLRVVQLSVGTSSDLVTDTWLEIDHDGTRNVLASSSLREKGVEGVIATTNSLVGGHLTIRLDAVLKAVQLPAGISGLNTALTNMNG